LQLKRFEDQLNKNGISHTGRLSPMREQDLKIALKYAPIICQETEGNQDERYQDYFCCADYDGDIKANNNWDNLPLFKDDLKAEVYFSLVETASHYFILYSVYHPRDWKPVLAHENDMEHAQVVVKKQGRGGVVQFLTTNAHLDYFVYHNADETLPISDILRQNHYAGTIFFHDTHPIITVEPGSGSIAGVGHGIRGLTGNSRRRWRPGSNPAFNFPGREGIVGFPDDNNQGEIPDRTIAAQNIKYSLIPVETSLWPLKDIVGDNGLFGEAIRTWVADRQTYFNSRTGIRLETRKDYLSRIGATTVSQFSKSFNGDNGTGDDGKTPFAYELMVPFIPLKKMEGMPDIILRTLMQNSSFVSGASKFDNFFDPAHAWFLRLEGQVFSTEYIYNPFLGIL
jgi:hypothetical protein